MALENFRTQKIIWDRANKKIFEKIEASSGDSNGRKLVVQVINQETTESLSGTTLSLGWKSRKGAKGLDAFDVVDASKGIFEIYYTTEMLSNIGNIEASLILINSTSRIESSAFTISVRPSTVDDESVESENSFTALTEALVKVNDFDAQLAQTVRVDGSGQVTYANLSQEVREQFTGGNTAIVGKDAVITETITDNAVTGEKIDDVSTTYQAATDNIFNKNTSINGGYFSGSSGAWITNESFASTGYMPVKPNKIYSFTSSSNYAFFDADFNYIGGGYGLKSSLTPTNIAYMSNSLTVANLNTYMVVEGDVLPTQYIEYIGVPVQYTFGEKWKFPENFIDDYKKLDEAMYRTFVDKEKTIDLDWVSGSMTQDGTLGSNTKRVRSNVFKTLSSKINIIPLGNKQYEYLIAKYNTDGSFVSLTTTWISISSSITVDTNYQYRLILRYSSDTEMIPNNVNSDVIVVEQTDIGKSVGLFEKIVEKKITEVSGEDYSSDFNKVNNFTVDVNVSESDVTSNSLEIQDTPNVLKDNAILLLPDNYKTKGKPTQLIINCHGAGTNITSTTSTLSQPIPNLLKLGYAVLDVNGRPQDLPGLSGLHYGAPFALSSYLKAYKHVIENFNVTKRVFVIGTSMGGLTSNMLVQSGAIPVIAQASLCGVVDHFKQAWSRTWNVGQRQAIADYFNFEGTPPTFTDDEIGLPPSNEEQAYYIANIDKTIGFNPMIKNTYNWENSFLDNYFDDVEEANYSTLIKHHNVPLKIWHNSNDWTVQPRYSRYFVQAIRNAGGLAYYREFPDGGHNAWDNGAETTMKDINGIDFTVKATTYELYQWFKRFE